MFATVNFDDMKNSSKILLGILAVVALLAIWGFSVYNKLVAADEKVQSSWAQVENVYQRRADLIPNLVATVKGYAAHEQATLEGVVEARAAATAVTVDASKLSEAQIAAFQQSQGALSSALGRLMAIAENYPELKANENFRDLQAQLEGTENRIATERMAFNKEAQAYNTMVRRFPNNIIASICGFEKKGYFQAEEGAAKAPKVEF